MDQGNGTPARYTECFQFMIAPTDLSGSNAIRHCARMCSTIPGDARRAKDAPPARNWKRSSTTLQAAGIFVVVSAGNGGPNCSTVSDVPAIYDASFSVGAL